MCFVDRANIGNARLAGLEEDLGLTGYDYNLLLTVFYIVRTGPLSVVSHPNTNLFGSLTSSSNSPSTWCANGSGPAGSSPLHP